MEFRVLGSFEVRAGGVVLPLRGLRERTVLAVLVLDAGRMVPVSRLVDAAWPDDPPGTAVKQVRNAVSRLRAALAAGESAGGGVATARSAATIQADGCGYRLDAAGEDIDARLFEARVAEARHAATAGHPGLAAVALRSALALWRGPALAGMSGPVLEAAAAAWEERRRSAQDSYYEQMLALGEHAGIVPELSAVLGEDRLREKTAGQLMLALYRCGRQGDALTVYRELSAALADRLGLDPGADLHRLHQQILTRDPTLGRDGKPPEQESAARPDQPGRPVIVPRQLPVATRHFVGRASELGQLDELLGQAADAAPVIITAIGGTAGAGKTALAIHWAYRIAPQFPDGQLYVNLRGFDPAAAPVEPAEAIRGFLDALSVPPERVPAGLEDRSGLYRSLLVGRRLR
jgi:DNA-binding SARP family transcriptional activator